MGKLGIDDVDDLSGVTLLSKDREELFGNQSECTFIFNRPGGWPSGVVMSYVYSEDSIWIASVIDRPQVSNLSVDPRVTVVVSNSGTETQGRQMIAVRGVTVVHEPGTATFDRMLLIIGSRLQPADPMAFVRLLNTPKRRILQVVPAGVSSSHDSRRMPGDGRGGPAELNSQEKKA
jgi:hypothetical protein